MVKLNNSWDILLKNEFQKDYYLNLRRILANEYKSYTIYPDMHMLFNSLKLTDYDDVSVVILGQDPYINENQAHGLSFSVLDGVSPPQSLKNIYKEIASDLNIEMNFTKGNLTNWAKQGVLLLNTTLSVRAGQSNSHKDIGWSIFTDNVISLLNQSTKPIVFLLWGNHAKSKKALITNPSHLILTASHPSPLSAHTGFFGCAHFSKANEFLTKNNRQPIDWSN